MNLQMMERGRIDDRLSSMNDDALELLHRVFIDCEEDTEGKHAQYRFFAYVSSMYHKHEMLINETIPGKSGKKHKIPIAVKNNGMYVAVGFNKPTGHAVSKKDIKKFYEIVDDVKSGDHGTLLVDAVFGSSAGFKGEALVELENLSKMREDDPEEKLKIGRASCRERV